MEIVTTDRSCIRCNKVAERYLRDTSGYCKACRAEVNKEWRDRNPDKVKILARRSTLKVRGINEEQYQVLLEKQGGKCGICHGSQTKRKTGLLMNFAVDHDHLTGEIRGLLCQDCNRGLGLLGDTIQMLQSAIVYLNGGQE